MKKINGWGIPVTLLAAVQAIGAKTFLKPCVHADGTAAACAGAGTWLLALGAATAVIGAVLLFAGGRKAEALLSGLALAGGLLIMLTPGTLTPICSMSAMRCRLVTRPAALVLGALIALCALVSLALSLRKRKA